MASNWGCREQEGPEIVEGKGQASLLACCEIYACQTGHKNTHIHVHQEIEKTEAEGDGWWPGPSAKKMPERR